ncbi:MAG: butyrate kinase [Eubacteriales bacterium]|nr:butyrate kinase [Eubacteriales bacterium]MDD4566066.1 butyrate kinase [Eubacteriales bacterium]
MSKRMLIFNMGSTSTKVAVYKGEEKIWVHSLSHPSEEIAKYIVYRDQYDYRKSTILNLLKEKGENLNSFDAFVSRGGIIRPVSGGTFYINQDMLDDSWSGVYGDHPCNIGGQIAFDFSQEYNVPALTVDPPMCDELCTEATYSGLPEIKRIGAFQALNHRAIARKYCKENGKDYSEVNLIVAHMGGGLSIAAHKLGMIIDVNNALAGDGPFAMERAGGLPTGDLIKMCYSGEYTREEMLRKVNGRGGMVAYLNTTDAREIEKRILGGDEYALEATKAMAYQVTKEIGAMAAVFKGNVDSILLTGGLAYWDRFVELISESVAFIAPISRYPGENEMESLALGACRVLIKTEDAKVYESKLK